MVRERIIEKGNKEGQRESEVKGTRVERGSSPVSGKLHTF